MIETMMLNFFSFIDGLSIYDIGFSAIVYGVLSLFLINFLAQFRTTTETINFCFINVGIITGAVVLNRALFHSLTPMPKGMLYICLIFALNLATFICYKLYYSIKETKHYNTQKCITNMDLTDVKKDDRTDNSNETKTIVIQENKRDDKNLYKIDDYDYYYSQNLNDKYADPYTSKALTGDRQDIDNSNIKTTSETTDEGIKKEKNTETSANVVLSQNNNAQIEENVMQKVQTLINKNNIRIDDKINELNNDINNIGNGVQGVVDRMSKLFELINQTIKMQIKQQQEN